jgi:hypothetical protein
VDEDKQVERDLGRAREKNSLSEEACDLWGSLVGFNLLIMIILK